MSYGIVELVAPAAEPITLREAKSHLQISPAVIRDDVAIAKRFIPQVRREFEDYCNLSAITRTMQFTVDVWPPSFYLPRGPVQSVDRVEYLDKEYIWQEVPVDEYRLVNDREPAVLEPSHDSWTSWPENAGQRAGIRVAYVCGYGDAPVEIPENMKGVLLRMLESRFRFRGEGELPRELYWAMDEFRIGDEFLQYGTGTARGIDG